MLGIDVPQSQVCQFVRGGHLDGVFEMRREPAPNMPRRLRTSRLAA